MRVKRHLCRDMAMVMGRIVAFTLISVVGFTFSGCSSGNGEPLMELVPADAAVVKTVDLQALFNEAGCPVPVREGMFLGDAQKIVSLVALPDMRDALSLLVAGKPVVELSNMIGFTTSGGHDVLLFDVVDETELGVRLTSSVGTAWSDGPDGLRFMHVGSAVVVADGGGHCWLAPDLDTVSESLVSARASHFGAFNGVREFLDGDNAVNIAVNCGNSMLSVFGGSDRWFCVAFKVNSRSVSAVGEVMDRDGRTDSIGGSFDVIDTDFLRYTPERSSVVMAFGKYDGNVRALGALLGRFAPIYLEQADGTTSLCAMPVSGKAEAVAEQTPGSWSVQTMVHVPESQLSVGIDQYAAAANVGVRQIDSNQWAYATDSAEYYYGSYDGYLVFSTNREISGRFNNEFTEDFSGKRAAIVIDIPAGSVLATAWKLPYGLTFKLSVDAMSWKARINFTGTDMPAFKALLDLPQLPDIHSRYSGLAGM